MQTNKINKFKSIKRNNQISSDIGYVRSSLDLLKSSPRIIWLKPQNIFLKYSQTLLSCLSISITVTTGGQSVGSMRPIWKSFCGPQEDLTVWCTIHISPEKVILQSFGVLGLGTKRLCCPQDLNNAHIDLWWCCPFFFDNKQNSPRSFRDLYCLWVSFCKASFFFQLYDTKILYLNLNFSFK